MIPLTLKKQKIICVVGSTATGKTALSIPLSQAVHGEVISADSRQVYQGLDIGSGKVTHEEMQGVPHYMLDVADPKGVFSAADFVQGGRRAIEEIIAHGAVPIVVGGTGFYIDALLGRISLAKVAPNEMLRNTLEHDSLEELQEKLKKLDPERFETVEQKNPVRLIRSIEIAEALGKVPKNKNESPYNILWIGLRLPLAELSEKIKGRLVARLNAGMLEEARTLHARGLSYERMIELGLEYRFMALHLCGRLSYDDMCTAIVSESIKYAKRQMTWFKRNKDIQWISPNETKQAIASAEEFLQA